MSPGARRGLLALTLLALAAPLPAAPEDSAPRSGWKSVPATDGGARRGKPEEPDYRTAEDMLRAESKAILDALHSGEIDREEATRRLGVLERRARDWEMRRQAVEAVGDALTGAAEDAPPAVSPAVPSGAAGQRGAARATGGSGAGADSIRYSTQQAVFEGKAAALVEADMRTLSLTIEAQGESVAAVTATLFARRGRLESAVQRVAGDQDLRFIDGSLTVKPADRRGDETQMEGRLTGALSFPTTVDLAVLLAEPAFDEVASVDGTHHWFSDPDTAFGDLPERATAAARAEADRQFGQGGWTLRQVDLTDNLTTSRRSDGRFGYLTGQRYRIVVTARLTAVQTLVSVNGAPFRPASETEGLAPGSGTGGRID